MTLHVTPATLRQINALMPPQRYAKAPRRPSEEETFQNELIRVAASLGYSYYHTHDSRRSPKGWPDLVLCKPPRLLFIECKNRKLNATPEQQMWLDLLSQFAGTWTRDGTFTERIRIEVHLWRAPGDWTEIVRALGYPQVARQ